MRVRRTAGALVGIVAGAALIGEGSAGSVGGQASPIPSAGAKPAEAATKTSFSSAEIEAQLRVYGAQVRGTDPTSVTLAEAPHKVPVGTSQDAAGSTYELTDARGSYEASIIDTGDSLQLLIHNHAASGEELSVFVMQRDPGTKALNLVARPLSRAKPATAHRLEMPAATGAKAAKSGSDASFRLISSDRPAESAALSQTITICYAYGWDPYVSLNYAVAFGEIYGCNQPAVLEVLVAEDVAIGNTWYQRGYIDNYTTGTYYYRDVLLRCTDTTSNFKYKAYYYFGAGWPSGYDDDYQNSNVVTLACHP